MHANNQCNKPTPILTISDIHESNVHLSRKVYGISSRSLAEVLKY
jgi:hypothetical protein